MPETDTITPGSGRDGRVVAEYLARRKRLRGLELEDAEINDLINDIWLDLARKYKCPVRELKDIVNRYQVQERPTRSFDPPVPWSLRRRNTSDGR